MKAVSPHSSSGLAEDPDAVGDQGDLLVSEDRKKLQQLLNELKDPKSVRGLSFSPGLRCLLALPPDVICDRLFNIVAAVNLLHALILSSIWGSAAAPIDVSKLPENVQLIGDIFNLCNLLNVVFTVMGSLISAYLMMGIGGCTPESAYRALIHMGPFVLIEYLTAAAGTLCIASCCLSLWIYSSHSMLAAIVGTAFSIVISNSLFVHFGYYGVAAFPNYLIHWAHTFGGGIMSFILSRKSWERASHCGKYLVAEAAFQHGDKADGGSDSSTGPSGACAEELTLMLEFLKRAIPSTTDFRRAALAHNLLEDDISLETMKLLVSSQGGASVLFTALDLEETGGIQLRRGERMRIVAALQSDITAAKIAPQPVKKDYNANQKLEHAKERQSSENPSSIPGTLTETDMSTSAEKANDGVFLQLPISIHEMPKVPTLGCGDGGGVGTKI